MKTFVIAEIGSTWELDLEKLKRLAHAIKECGADAMKLQWTSSGLAMAQRRRLGEEAAAMYYKWLQYDPALLIEAKGIADSVGLEFMCSTFLIQDIAVVAPLVSRFKVSAFESGWREFIQAHEVYGKMIIASVNPDKAVAHRVDRALYCVSKYPTAIEDLHLADHIHMHDGMRYGCDGLSDHTANVLTGAAAVAAGASIVEAHIRLWDTDEGNPDYKHSLVADKNNADCFYCRPARWCNACTADWGQPFAEYVQNIRTVEKML